MLAALEPRSAHGFGAESADSVVPMIEPANQVASQLGSIDRGTIALDLERRGELGELGRKVVVAQVRVQADADHGAPGGLSEQGRGWVPSERSTRMPAIFRPSTRTSLGHLILAVRPVQSKTTSAVAIAPSAVNQASPDPPGESPGIKSARRKEQDRHQDRRTRGGRPGPALATSAGGLFLGQDDQAIVGPGVSSPSSRGHSCWSPGSRPRYAARPSASPARARSDRDRAARRAPT